MARVTRHADSSKVQAVVGGRASAPQRPSIVELIALVALGFIYFLDVITPADLSLEVAYEVPVAISGLTGSRSAFVRFALLAAIFNFLGFLSDGYTTGFHDAIAIQNRVISLASLTVVCTLMIVVQRMAEKTTVLREQHERLLIERALAHEVRRRHEELASRQDVIDELVEAIAHDVRTPLAALSLTLKQALRGQYGALPDAYREVATESGRSIDDISRLAESLLAVARFEAGTAPAERARVDVGALVDDLAIEFGPLVRTRDVVLVTSVARGVAVAGATGDLRRALANLIANAVRHTPPGGSICISAQPTDLGWRIDVCDDGVGVAPAVAQNLFGRYAAGGGGTGLGLSLVKRIAERFGGTVAYEARQPCGSRFSLDLRAWT